MGTIFRARARYFLLLQKHLQLLSEFDRQDLDCWISVKPHSEPPSRLHPGGANISLTHLLHNPLEEESRSLCCHGAALYRAQSCRGSPAPAGPACPRPFPPARCSAAFCYSWGLVMLWEEKFAPVHLHCSHQRDPRGGPCPIYIHHCTAFPSSSRGFIFLCL